MITTAVFYYFYLLVVLFFIVYSLFNIYHLLRFGFVSVINILMIILYVVAASVLLIYSFDLLLPIDWTTTLFDWQTFGSTNNNFNL